jgi:hypothetical protein
MLQKFSFNEVPLAIISVIPRYCIEVFDFGCPRYLAETPLAHRNRVYKLLGFLLSVTREGQDGYVRNQGRLTDLVYYSMS